MKFIISKEVHDKFPDLEEILLPVYGVKVRQDEEILTEKCFQKSLAGFAGEDFFNQEILIAFRKFSQEIGLNPSVNPPSVENLFRRYKETGKFSRINNVVDASNAIAVETLVPTGVFDLAQIRGDLTLRFSKEGEEFRPLGGGVEYLPAGLTVIADEEKILNLFPYRDSVYPKITNKTQDVLILADKVKGVTVEQTKEAVEKVGALLVETAGAKIGKIFYSQVGEVVILKERKSMVFGKDKKKRVFSGLRPTNFLHIGNYLGMIKGALELQNKADFDCIYSVVDLHGITTPFKPAELQDQIKNLALDLLGCGLNPQKCHLMIQSQVPEHVELAYLLSTIFPVSRLEDLPTFKDKKAENPDYINMGLLYYPVLMAADILLYKVDRVPVGKDQVPHIEVTREFARIFNRMFGKTFPEPQAHLMEGAYVPSLKGEGKMSKSIEGSYILLTDSREIIEKRLAGAPTDTGKGSKVPESGGAANLLEMVKLFEGDKACEEYKRQYLNEGIRYQDLKHDLANAIYEELRPIQERRRYYEENPELVEGILEEGREYCSQIAAETLKEVKEKMGLV